MTPGLPSSDKLFRQLFEEVPCYGSMLDTELNIIAANRRCRETFTTPFSRKCYQVFKSRGKVCEDCPAVTTLTEGSTSESVEVLTGRSGQELHVICRTVPIQDENRSVRGVLHLSVHAGQGEKLQQEMTAFDSQLKAVSHGIKGILASMEGGFYLWDSGLEKTRADRMEKGLQIVRRNFRRLKHLAHDVLYYVRDRSFHPERLDGVELLHRVARELKEDADAAGVRLVLANNIPHGIPMTADRRAVESAVMNLAASSLDDCYTDGRPIAHTITLGAGVDGACAVFEVADNGTGMDRDTLEKIFSFFFNPKGIEAAGVGLYIANKLARALQGSISIESEPGRGSLYRLRVPLHPAMRNEPGLGSKQGE